MIVAGFPEAQRDVVARLFWEAFSAKLAPVMGPDRRALSFLARVADAEHAISALDMSGRVVGLAGFKTAKGAFIGGSFSDLAAIYGWIGAAWRGGVLSVLEREVAPDVLLMDGIMVAPEARGRGVGTALLAAVRRQAVAAGCTQVRLDVIDSNNRARALYEREGFEAGNVQQMGVLRHVFGFRSATQMMCRVG